MPHATARVDLSAISENLERLRARAPQSSVMAVIKANGYGHGAVEVARTARETGVAWLGFAHPAEALQVRAAGDTGRMLAWLWVPGDPDVAAALAADVDLSVNSPAALAEIVRAAEGLGHRPRVHLKVDTGLSRNGCPMSDWDALVQAAHRSPVEVVAVWTHLANADAATVAGPSVSDQVAMLHAAVAAARGGGLEVPIVHCANTAGVIAHPQSHLDLVRLGIGMYGLRSVGRSEEPAIATAPAGAGAPSAAPLLRPAMSLESSIALTKTLPAGTAVGYGSTWVADRVTRVGLVPVGYADGLPRSASGRADVLVADVRAPIVGRIAMDQCVVDLSNAPGAGVGSRVVVFGDGRGGEPTADDLADAAGTIGYDVVTGIGSRVARVVVDGQPRAHSAPSRVRQDG